LKGYNARQLRAEFPDKRWTKSSINRLLKKLRGTVDRRQGSSRPRSSRTDENIDQVNDMDLSQENQRRNHCTVREISRGRSILKSFVVRIINRSAAEMLQEAKCARADWGELRHSHFPEENN